MNPRHRASVEDVMCVVRSVGERTTDVCVEMLHQQLGEAPTVVGIPVHRDMVRECFRLGRGSGKALLLTCDADALPYQGAVAELLRIHAEVPADYFLVVCEVDDHLFGGHRNGGLRLYRVDHLGLAMEVLEHSDPARPESGLVRPMARRGHPSAYGQSVVGLHDFGQFHRDVYRKAGFFAHEHPSLITALAERWRNGQASNPDFAVALYGLAHGLLVDTPGPDFLTSLSIEVGELGFASFEEVAPLSAAEVATLVTENPAVRALDEWVTFPAPRGLIARAREQRRLHRSVVADIVRRAASAGLRRLRG